MHVHAQSGLLEPERLTAGAADQFLAALDPAGERLFWVSNENATTELFGAELSVRSPQRLFDDAADATQPRVSPDGKRLLYLSFRSAATGELCVRDLAAQGLELGERRCFSLGGRTAMQALWSHDGKSALVVSREGLAGAIDLRRFGMDGGADSAGELILNRDLSSPALSPDGRYLLFVPVARAAGSAENSASRGSQKDASSLGASSMPSAKKNINADPGAGRAGVAPGARTSRVLGLLRLDRPDAPPKEIQFPLPGLPGFPAFSPDGKFVYFVQYLNDTNLDGVVDANDRAVLFRAPFDAGRDEPIEVAQPQQLTSADWDCQYPFPGKERLVATCLRGDALDVYSLPPGGVIPAEWTREQLEQELASNRSPWQRLHVYTRLLELDGDDRARALHLKRIIEQHLNMHEYQSAGFYSGQLERLAAAQAKSGALRAEEEPGEWEGEVELGQILHELSRHRRSLASIAEGQATHAVNDAMRERLEKLRAFSSSKSSQARLLAALVESELQDALGDIGRALALLDGVRGKIDAQALPVVLHLYGQRARELYEALGERKRLLEAELLLSNHPRLDEAEQLLYAGDYLRDLLRGRSREEGEALLAEAAGDLPGGSAASFEVQLEQTLRPLSSEPQRQAEIEQKIFALLSTHASYQRQREIVHQAVARARSASAEVLWYDVALRWADTVGKQHADRKRNEAIFKRVAMERAYVEWSRGDVKDAHEHFEAVAARTDSLEARAGAIDTAPGPDGTSAAAGAMRGAGELPPEASPELQFEESYRVARELAGEAEASAVHDDAERAKAWLKSALRKRPNDIPIHFLWAYLRHQEYLRSGDKTIAAKANAHYQIVLDLAREEPRYRAAALSGLGFLHGRLQNFGMAASYLEEREKLPFAGAESQLAVCTQRSRALLHAAHESEAAAEADACVALIDRTPALARFLPFALDRAALDHLDAKEPELAKARYDRLAALFEKDQGSLPPAPGAAAGAIAQAARRNRFVVQLGRASAELSLGDPAAALADLDRAEELFSLPGGIVKMQSIYARQSGTGAFKQELLDENYRALLDGLRARALVEERDRPAAEQPTQRRLALLRERAKRDGDGASGADDRRYIALAELNLAAAAMEAKEPAAALAHVEAGLRAADELEKLSATPVHHVTLALLEQYAQLHFEAGLPLARLQLDLPRRLARLYGELCDRPQPRFRDFTERFGLDLDRLALEGAPIDLPASAR